MKNKTSFKKGHVGYWMGKISLKRNGIYKNCLSCGEPVYVAKWQEKIGEGKYCSKKCYLKAPVSEIHRRHLSESHRGEKSGNWLGGITNKYYKRLNNYYWRILKKKVFARDSYTCQKCLKKPELGKLDCHHIIPYRRCGGDEKSPIFWNITINNPVNLISLCKSCHIKEERGITERERRGDYGFKAVLYLLS